MVMLPGQDLWSCSLPGTPTREIQENQTVRTMISRTECKNGAKGS